MATVVVGRVGTDVVVPSDVCVKSGVPTTDRVIIRGSTAPRWVMVLLVFTIVGWLFATAMTSRRYRVEVPFEHSLYDGWRQLRNFVVAVGSVGVIAAVVASLNGLGHPWVPLLLTVGAVALGTANTLRHHVGVQQRGPETLVLTRVHPAAAEAIVRGRALSSPSAPHQPTGEHRYDDERSHGVQPDQHRG
jgi:hypothetical protein